MRIAIVTAELRPYAWVGGLSDVVASLSRALVGKSQTVSVFCPLYRFIRENSAIHLSKLSDLEVSANRATVPFEVYTDPNSVDPRILFIGCDRYFDRDGIYLDPKSNSEYDDSFERWNFFSLAVLRAFREKDLEPDVVHCNDSHTALVPCYLRIFSELFNPGNQIGSLMTIHNLGYQGTYPSWKFALTGLPDHLFYPMQPLEFYGQLNMLKAGIVFGDILNTVSPRYAQEIQTQIAGHGLDGVLRDRSDDLYGVLNGIDTKVWNPETDPLIGRNFSISDKNGKKENKSYLQRIFGLPEINVPLVGMITRLVEQKGISLLEQIRTELVKLDCQFVFLGSGSQWWEDFLLNLQKEFPQKFAVKIGYDNSLAHQIEAGCDLFLMPSLYEPCGLNQMYSMRYGTVPLVRDVGGLSDSVIPFDPDSGKGTGFLFQDFTGESLLHALKNSLSLWQKDQKAWHRLMSNGMQKDFSWSQSADEYLALYRKAMDRTSNPGKSKS